MIQIISWLLIGLLVGPTLVALGPVVLAWLGGPELRERVGSVFVDRAIKMLGSAALIAKEQGGVALASTGTDAKLDADTVTVDGEAGHLRDDMNVKGYLKGRPFGIGLDTVPAYVTPLLAEIGERAASARESGRLGVQPDGGVRLDFELPKRPQVPDLRKACRVVEGSTAFRDGVVAEDWTRKSQEKFHDRMSLGQTLLLIGGFAVGVGCALAVARFAPDSGGGGVSVPIQIVGLWL
jgi:hypothetical protein